jgi:hypothetical protein
MSIGDPSGYGSMVLSIPKAERPIGGLILELNRNQLTGHDIKSDRLFSS